MPVQIWHLIVYRMIKEANRRPLHAIITSFPSRNRDTPEVSSHLYYIKVGLNYQESEGFCPRFQESRSLCRRRHPNL